MEKKLKALFDFQRFEKNPELEKMINESESRFGTVLQDEDLSLVSAAGAERLMEAPPELPATKLDIEQYDSMFKPK